MSTGARFFKSDLHLHTPADSSFNPHRLEIENSLIKEYVKKLKEKKYRARGYYRS